MKIKSTFLLIILTAVFLFGCGEGAKENEYQAYLTQIDYMEIDAGREMTVARVFPGNIAPQAKLILSLKLRYSTTSFASGSFPLARIKVDGQNLKADDFIKYPSCYVYLNCNWGDASCTTACNNYFFGEIGMDIPCGGKNYYHAPESDMLNIQLSSNFSNNMVPINPDGTDNAFYIDPEISGDPYLFEFDLTKYAAYGEKLEISVENPFAEYKDLMECYNPPASAGKLIIGQLVLRQENL